MTERAGLPRDRDQRAATPGMRILPALVGAVIGGFAIIATIVTAQAIDAARAERDTRYVDEVLLVLDAEIGRHADLTRAAVGLHEGSEDVDTSEMEAFLTSLEIELRFPAVTQVIVLRGSIGPTSPIETLSDLRPPGAVDETPVVSDDLREVLRRASETNRLVSGAVAGDRPGLVLARSMSAPEPTEDQWIVVVLDTEVILNRVAELTAFAASLELVSVPAEQFDTLGGLWIPLAESTPLAGGAPGNWALTIDVPDDESWVERWVARGVGLAGAATTMLAIAITAVVVRSRYQAVHLLAETQRSEERARAVLDRVPLGIIELHGETVVDMNPRARAVFGSDRLTPGEPLNLMIIDRATADRMPLREAIHADAASEALLVPGDDGHSDLEMIVELTELHGGRGLLFVEDVTDRSEASRQLMRAQKMEAIGLLAGGVAHDFNNLMSIVRGYTELVLDSAALGSDDRESLGHVLGATQRATAVVDQLLTLAQRGSTEHQLLEVDQVIAESFALMSNALGSGIERELRLGAAGCWIQLDRGQLEQVVMNLVFNARDAMPGGGRLEVWTDCDGTEIEIGVRDDGVGMTRAVVDRLFDAFFTTKATGTGLGLPMAQAIISGAGGRLEVDTEPGVGSTFRLRLPLVDPLDSELAGPAPKPAVAGGPTAPWRVMVVDDEAMLLDLTARLLSAAGFVTETASNAEDALERIDASGFDASGFDAVVSDIMLPGRSGVDLAQEVAARYPDIGIVLVSGYAAEVRDGRAELPERVAVLAKPFDPAELVARVHAAITNVDGG